MVAFLIFLCGSTGCRRPLFGTRDLFVTHYGQATFTIHDPYNRATILIDPVAEVLNRYELDEDFLRRVEVLFLSTKLPEYLEPGIIVKLRNLNPQVTIIATAEIVSKLERRRIYALAAVPGKSIELGDYQFRFTSGETRRGSEMVAVAGVLIKVDKISIYYTGPVRYFDPGTLNLGCNLDLLLVPIGGHDRTMDFFEAGKFAKYLAPKLVVPFDYESPYIQKKVFPEDFLRQLTDTTIKAFLPEPGKSFSL